MLTHAHDLGWPKICTAKHLFLHSNIMFTIPHPSLRALGPFVRLTVLLSPGCRSACIMGTLSLSCSGFSRLHGTLWLANNLLTRNVLSSKLLQLPTISISKAAQFQPWQMSWLEVRLTIATISTSVEMLSSKFCGSTQVGRRVSSFHPAYCAFVDESCSSTKLYDLYDLGRECKC
jgi:hypothetical protein